MPVHAGIADPEVSSVLQPILAGKVIDACEFPLVAGDDSAAESERLGGDQQIVAPHRSACPFKPGAEQAIGGICRRPRLHSRMETALSVPPAEAVRAERDRT
jgi:hypothetical protein